MSRPAHRKLEDVLAQATARAAAPSDPPRWIPQPELVRIVSDYLQFDVPPTLARSKLLEIAVKLNLVPAEAAQQAPNAYLSVEDLKQRLDGVAGGSKTGGTRAELLERCKRLGLVDDEEAAAPRTRPDVSQRKLDAQDHDEVCRTCSLSALLRGVRDKERIVEMIRSAAAQMSQVLHQRSVLVWLHIHRLLSEGKGLPGNIVGDSNATFFRHCLTVGVRGATTKDADISATIEALEFNSHLPSPLDAFPTLELPQGVPNAVSWAAKLYRTNFVNHFALLDKAIARVRRLASYELFGVVDASLADDSPSAASGDNLYRVVCAVESGKVDGLERSLADVASDIRSRFGLPDGEWLTRAWLKANLEKSVRFTLDVAQTMDRAKREAVEAEAEGKKVRRGAAAGIKWIPTHGVKLHALTLDATDLAPLLSGGEVVEGLASDVVSGALKAGIARQFGRLAGLTFSGTLTTDGTSVSVHFKRAGKKDRQDALKSSAAEGADTAKAPRHVPRVLLQVDPGRVNMATIAVRVDGKVFKLASGRRLVFKLSARQYYSVSGAHNARVRRTLKRRRNATLRTLDAALARTSLKTGDAAQVLRYLRAMNRHHDEAWAFSTSRSSAKQKFQLKAGKRRALDRSQLPALQPHAELQRWSGAAPSSAPRGRAT